jgi:16S rRNA (adenine1518-N6/adenine1519-N6)-dimethyltransferase
LLEAVEHIVDQHFMLQKEVVERMAAGPGGKEYGRLSVMLQWRYRVESLFDVPPESFDPPPRVDSAIVRMQPWTAPRALPAGVLEELVRVAFSQRRKLLRHTLGRWLDERGYAGRFDLQRRAEEVAVDEYLDLAAALSAAT